MIATAATEIATATTEDVRKDKRLQRQFALGIKTRAAVGFNTYKRTGDY